MCLPASKAARRAENRQNRALRRRALNEPPHLTGGEETVNAVSHGTGALLAAAGLILLLRQSHTAAAIAASCIYGVSMLLMLLNSCLYHAMPTGSTAKRVLRRFDYASIYLLIGGTFAPLLLLFLGTKAALVMFWIQWGVIVVGVTLLAALGPGWCRPLHFTLYFTIGWAGLLVLPGLYIRSPALLWYVLAGGLCYTVGMIPFARCRRYDHCVWHFFVLAGAILHWAGIYTLVY